MSVPACLEERFRIRSYEVEPDGRLRLVVLGRMLQEAAWRHAQLLGSGFAARQTGALFWVLSRLRLRMDRYPCWGEEFTVRTWPVGTEKLFAVREFVLLDGDRVLGRATSGWLIVDGTSGRPVRPQRFVADFPLTPSEFDSDLTRLPDLPVAAEQDAHTVQYHDIDQYRHANNTAYLEWMIDAIAAAASAAPPRAEGAHLSPHGDSFSIPAMAELAVDFHRELVHGDQYVTRLSDGGAATDCEVVRADTAEQICRARFGWQTEQP